MKKRIVTLFITGVLVLSTLLTGCSKDKGKAEGNKAADNGPWYKAQYFDFTLEDDEYIGNMELYRDSVYLLAEKYNEEADSVVTKLQKITLDETTLTELGNIEMGEDHYLMDMFVDDSGVYLASQLTEWNDEYTKVLKSEYKITQYDFDGTKVSEIDLTEVLKDKGEEGNPSYIYTLVRDAEGNFVFTDGNLFIMACDNEGNVIAEIEAKAEWNNELFVGEDGTVYYVYMDEQSWKQVVTTVDVKENKLSESLGSFGMGNEIIHFVDADQKIWMTEDNSLVKYDLKSEEKTTVLNWLDYDVNGNNVRLMEKTAEGKFVAFTEDYAEKVTYEMVTLEESDEPLTDKTVITYATNGSDSNVTDAIIRFNKNSDKYRIKVIDYYNEEDYEAGMNAFNEAVLSGNVADIISVDWSQYKSMARKGLYADLNELMDNDADINREDYFENILEAYEVDGKLYALPTSFEVSTLFGKTSVWGKEPGITEAEISKVMDSMPKDVQLLEGMSKSYWFFLALQGTLENYVNWETGECSFDSEEFIALLEMANRFPKEYDYENETMSPPEQVQTGKVLLYGENMSEVSNYQLVKELFGEEITAVGYPSVKGNGGLIQNMNGIYAIAEDSDCKEGAWEFIKYMISEEYQSQYIHWSTPIHRASFEKLAAKAMEYDTYINEDGEEVEAPQMTYGWDGFEISVYHATKEDIDEYTKILEGATVLSSYNEEIMTILQEEVEPFFEGQKSAKDVANIIQGRVKIYVNENR